MDQTLVQDSAAVVQKVLTPRSKLSADQSTRKSYGMKATTPTSKEAAKETAGVNIY